MGTSRVRLAPCSRAEARRRASFPLTLLRNLPLLFFFYSPSFPIASTGQESMASWHWASSSGVAACLWTYE